MIRPALELVHSRRNLAMWQRDRQVQIFAELSALRQDLKRLKRLTTQRGVCDQCRQGKQKHPHWNTLLTLDDDGFWRCSACRFHREERQA